LVCIY